jgi:glycosyltransferase involved in cell wall biosynthesis
MTKFSIIITTKNRILELKKTLLSLNDILKRKDVELLICDDASIDGTALFLKEKYSNHTLVFNQKSKGLIHNRNLLNGKAKGTYLISLDDDLNFLTKEPLEKIDSFFKKNPRAAVLSFRIFWNKTKPKVQATKQKIHRVNSFAGGAHVLRKSFWEQTPNYPAWFEFYGEEDFLSYHAFLLKKEIYYFPSILTHHRVNLVLRKKDKDYFLRSKRSLRSGWFLYLLFCPLKEIPKLFLYTVYAQVKKNKIKNTMAVFLAFADLFLNIKNILRNKCRLTSEEWKAYRLLPSVVLYWMPKEE